MPTLSTCIGFDFLLIRLCDWCRYPAFEFSKNILVTWYNDEPTLRLRFTMKRLDRSYTN